MRFLGSTSVRIMSWFVHTSCEFRISPIRWARNQNSKDRNSSAVEDHLEVYPSGESYGIESHLTSRNGVLILPHHQGGRGPKPPKPHLQLDTSVLESEYLHSKTKNSANRGHGLLPLVASEFWISENSEIHQLFELIFGEGSEAELLALQKLWETNRLRTSNTTHPSVSLTPHTVAAAEKCSVNQNISGQVIPTLWIPAELELVLANMVTLDTRRPDSRTPRTWHLATAGSCWKHSLSLVEIRNQPMSERNEAVEWWVKNPRIDSGIRFCDCQSTFQLWVCWNFWTS